MGSFIKAPFYPFKCSPLSLRPKATLWEFLLLHDLSHLYDEDAVNGGIRDKNARVKYASVKDAVRILVDRSGFSW